MARALPVRSLENSLRAIVCCILPPHGIIHAASNGLAERAVKTVMQGLNSGSLRDRLSRFLFQLRITQQPTTGISPAELLFGNQKGEKWVWAPGQIVKQCIQVNLQDGIVCAGRKRQNEDPSEDYADRRYS